MKLNTLFGKVFITFAVLGCYGIFLNCSDSYAGGKNDRKKECVLSASPYEDTAFWKSQVRQITAHKAKICGADQVNIYEKPSLIEKIIKNRHALSENLVSASKLEYDSDTIKLESEIQVARFLQKKIKPLGCIDKGLYDSLVKSVRAIRGHSDFDYNVEEISTLLYLALKNKEEWGKSAQTEGKRVEVPVNFCYWGMGPGYGLKEKPLFFIDPDGHLSLSYRSKYKESGTSKRVTKRLVLTNDGRGLYLNPRAVAEEKLPGIRAFAGDQKAAETLGETKETPSPQNPRRNNPPLQKQITFINKDGRQRHELEMPVLTRDLRPKKAGDFNKIPFSEMTDIITRLAKDLANHHKNNLVLNDVKPKNMMFRGFGATDRGPKKVARIIDRGSSQSAQEIEEFRKKGVLPYLPPATVEYVAPERLTSNYALDEKEYKEEVTSQESYLKLVQKGDVYSFGVSLSEILSDMDANRPVFQNIGLRKRFTEPYRTCTQQPIRRLSVSDAVCIRREIEQLHKELVHQLQPDVREKRTDPFLYHPSRSFILAKIIAAATNPDPKKRPTMEKVSDWLGRLDALAPELTGNREQETWRVLRGLNEDIQLR